MKIEDIKKNIRNLKRWLLESPKDEDYLRLLNEFENNIHIDIFDFFELFQVKEKITMNLFLLILDWLFVLGLIDNKNGVIKKCF